MQNQWNWESVSLAQLMNSKWFSYSVLELEWFFICYFTVSNVQIRRRSASWRSSKICRRTLLCCVEWVSFLNHIHHFYPSDYFENYYLALTLWENLKNFSFSKFEISNLWWPFHCFIDSQRSWCLLFRETLLSLNSEHLRLWLTCN